MSRFRVYGTEMRVTCIKLLFAGGLMMSPVSGHTTDAISFAASDRVQVFADYYSAGSKAKPDPAFSPSRFKSRGIRNYRADACHARIQCAGDRSTIWR
jgi:hypothetical protein